MYFGSCRILALVHRIRYLVEPIVNASISGAMLGREAASSHSCGGICTETCQKSETVFACAGAARPSDTTMPAAMPRPMMITA